MDLWKKESPFKAEKVHYNFSLIGLSIGLFLFLFAGVGGVHHLVYSQMPGIEKTKLICGSRPSLQEPEFYLCSENYSGVFVPENELSEGETTGGVEKKVAAATEEGSSPQEEKKHQKKKKSHPKTRKSLTQSSLFHPHEEVVVTATMTRKAVKDCSASVSVITPQAVEAIPASNALNLLGQFPGVFVRRTGDFGRADIDIRGLGNRGRRIAVLVNGRPEKMGLFGCVVSHAFPLDNVERIELVRGPASVLYGCLLYTSPSPRD